MNISELRQICRSAVYEALLYAWKGSVGRVAGVPLKIEADNRHALKLNSRPSRRALSQFWSFQIRRTTLLN